MAGWMMGSERGETVLLRCNHTLEFSLKQRKITEHFTQGREWSKVEVV